MDFLEQTEKFGGDIVTNPPFILAEEFIRKALDLVDDGSRVCMFLKVQFLEGKARRKLFEEYPPKTIWVSSSRISCGRNGQKATRGAMAFAWWVWQKGYHGDTVVRWFN